MTFKIYIIYIYTLYLAADYIYILYSDHRSVSAIEQLKILLRLGKKLIYNHSQTYRLVHIDRDISASVI